MDATIPNLTGPIEGFTPIPSATAHVRRVTLNILRLAACTPPELRAACERLAGFDWSWDRLNRDDAELIFGMVDKELVDRAKMEFEADTSSLIDHKRSEGECRLCGQQHIRWEFRLRNNAGGSDHWTGSDCILRWGFTVDGEATAEAAMEKLRKRINEAIKDATREEWQAEHPDHVADMAIVAQTIKASSSYPARHRLRWPKDMMRDLKAALKYYRDNGFLTEKKTEDMYPVGLSWCQARLQEVRELTDKPARAERYWNAWIRQNPDLSGYELSKVRAFIQNGWERVDLAAWNLQVIETVERRHDTDVPMPPPPVKGIVAADAEPTPVRLVDDTSDLPF